MPRRLVVRPEAEADVRSAYHWYEEQRLGLGDELLEELGNCFGRIEAGPELFAKVHGQYRRALTRRFPFKVYYIAERDHISVVAVLHSVRHPELWRKRRG